MTVDNRKNIKLAPDTFNKHNKRRKRLGLSWEEYLERQRPLTPEEIVELMEEAMERLMD